MGLPVTATAPDKERRQDSAQQHGDKPAAGAGAKTQAEEADRLYEERIEDEYAKREGGA
ncbi:Uncharacterized protein TPAR_02444 [Tolypocladium paradoxum]|uniref:Uncharacterized protein n=1 Tax=Tolypocladium paradoxum TaxID=94208 RepID=A0A2S4L4M4_9HYPO|nr:Uncharacterized protein TPAR_02444 [Tolypocladium paradoxum]